MDRLTNPGFNYAKDFASSHLQSWPIAQALKRLQAYEDSGLSPEYVQAFADLIRSISESERIEVESKVEVNFDGNGLLSEMKRLGWWGEGTYKNE